MLVIIVRGLKMTLKELIEANKPILELKKRIGNDDYKVLENMAKEYRILADYWGTGWVTPEFLAVETLIARESVPYHIQKGNLPSNTDQREIRLKEPHKFENYPMELFYDDRRFSESLLGMEIEEYVGQKRHFNLDFLKRLSERDEIREDRAKDRQPSFENLISKIKTPEGRKIAIERATSDGLIAEPSMIDNTIAELVQTKRWSSIEDYVRNRYYGPTRISNAYERVLQEAVRQKNYGIAFGASVMLGRLEEALQHSKKIDQDKVTEITHKDRLNHALEYLLEQTKNHKFVLELAKRYGEWDIAGEMCEGLGDAKEAVNFYRKAVKENLPYERANYYPASSIQKRIVRLTGSDNDRRLLIKIQSKNPYYAIESALEFGWTDYAIELSNKNGDFSKAGSIKEKLGDIKGAIESYREGKSYDEALRLLKSSNWLEDIVLIAKEAMIHEERQGRFMEAIKYAETTGDDVQAEAYRNLVTFLKTKAG